jgi:DNA-binding response OmpR family regulator
VDTIPSGAPWSPLPDQQVPDQKVPDHKMSDQQVSDHQVSYHAAHVLVVDDDELIRKTLQLHLEAAGLHVSLASNGLEAVAFMENERPDIIILDLFMPEMDGFETLRRLNRSARRSRILAISGAWTASDCSFLAMAAKLGADGVLNKPFTASELTAAVETLLPPVTSSSR